MTFGSGPHHPPVSSFTSKNEPLLAASQAGVDRSLPGENPDADANVDWLQGKRRELVAARCNLACSCLCNGLLALQGPEV